MHYSIPLSCWLVLLVVVTAPLIFCQAETRTPYLNHPANE
jgi:hypothetical protein